MQNLGCAADFADRHPELLPHPLVVQGKGMPDRDFGKIRHGNDDFPHVGKTRKIPADEAQHDLFSQLPEDAIEFGFIPSPPGFQEGLHFLPAKRPVEGACKLPLLSEPCNIAAVLFGVRQDDCFFRHISIVPIKG